MKSFKPMRMISLFVSGLLLLFVGLKPVFADRPAPNKEYKQYSSNKKIYILMTPDSYFGDVGKGRVFQVNHPDDRPLWQVDWYAREVELTNEGRYLIRRGPWATSFDDLAIAFYDQDKLLREYRISNLVIDKNSVQKSVSHFFWEIKNPQVKTGLSENNKNYILLTCDKNLYTFDVATGNIIKKLKVQE